MFNVYVLRGGYHAYGGIFWYDSSLESTQPYEQINQFFGHTITEGPMRIKNWVNMHIEDGN